MTGGDDNDEGAFVKQQYVLHSIKFQNVCLCMECRTKAHQDKSPQGQKAHWTKAHQDKSPQGQNPTRIKAHLYTFNRDKFERMDKPQGLGGTLIFLHT